MVTCFHGTGLLAGQGVDLPDALQLVAEEAQAPGAVLVVGREDLDHVAAHPEGAAVQVGVVAAVLQLDQLLQQIAYVHRVAGVQLDDHLRVGLDRADAVDAGHRGDDDDVVALQQGPRRGVAHAVDLLVHRGVLLDEGVGARHVGLGLVVVVVGDEVLDGVLGEEALHLAVELGGQGLVGSEHQGRALQPRNDLGHGVGLARAGDAEQHLVDLAVAGRLDQCLDGARLVAGRLVGADQLERTLGRHRRAARGLEGGKFIEPGTHGSDLLSDGP